MSAAPAEATFLLLMIYLPPRAQRTQRMEKFRGLLKIDPLIKPQISLCALCELCGEISSGNCCSYVRFDRLKLGWVLGHLEI